MHIGLSLRLIRDEAELSQLFVAKQLGISRTTLDRFEKAQVTLSDSYIEKLCEILKIKHIPVQGSYPHIAERFYEVFNCLYYKDTLAIDLMKNMSESLNDIYSTPFYLVYYIFSYGILIFQNDSYKKIHQEKICKKLNYFETAIERVEEFCPIALVSLFNEFRAERYIILNDFGKAAIYQSKVTYSVFDYQFHGLHLHHKAIILLKKRENMSALKCVEDAKYIYQKDLNIARIIELELINAKICENTFDYNSAKNIYEKCLKVIHNKIYDVDEVDISIRLSRVYLYLGQYVKVNDILKYIVKNYKNDKIPYIYLIWSYYRMGDTKMANFYYNLCKDRKISDNNPAEGEIFELLGYILKDRYDNVNNFIITKEFYKNDDRMLGGLYGMLIIYYKDKGNNIKVKEFNDLLLSHLHYHKVG